MDQQTATALGFPKQKYMAIERERRWLCRTVPHERVVQTDIITDLYITGAQLRLREARPTDGGTPTFKLSRKADVDARTRLITTIYLPEEEFALLRSSLQGPTLKKLRHKLQPLPGVSMSVDEFQGTLGGLVLAEAECETQDALAVFPVPDFALREVTDDARFSGASLAKNGLPEGF